MGLAAVGLVIAGPGKPCFDLANLLLSHHKGMQPYHSVLKQKIGSSSIGMSGVSRQFSIVGGEDEVWLKIAFASDDGTSVNQHFWYGEGFFDLRWSSPMYIKLMSATQFDQYGVDAEEKKTRRKIKNS